MNTIKIGTGQSQKVFTDADILQGNVFVSNSPIGAELESDEFTFTIKSTQYTHQSFAPKGYDLTLSSDRKVFVTNKTYQHITLLQYATPVEIWHDTSLIGKFYVKDIQQNSIDTFTFTCISAIGLLSYIVHYGGVYGVDNVVFVTDVLEDIIGNIDVTIDSVFDNMRIQGYLPKASARDNLQQVLFAVGGAVLKDAQGQLVIKYNQPESATVIPDDSIYIDGTINKTTKATSVVLVEHSYFKGATTQAEDLFDNLGSGAVSVIGQEITFSEPYYDFHAYNSSGTDITSSFIVRSGVNFVVVGTNSVNRGRITGKPYIHSQRKLTKSNLSPQSYEANEVSVTNATLVSPYNSSNCLERLASYYSTANEVDMGMVYTNEKSGTLLEFADFYGGANKVGYVKSLSIDLSKNLKAQTSLAVDWLPNHLGNTYDSYVIIDKSVLGNTLEANWTPQDSQGNSLVGKGAYIVMFNGAGGGQGSYGGTAGTDAGDGTATDHQAEDGEVYSAWSVGSAGVGGTGGNAGAGGSKCSRYGSAMVTLGSSHHIKLGEGGAGGNVNGGLGGAGGVSYFDSFTSNQNDLSGSYVNIIDGSTYCSNGVSGVRGANGGNGGTASAKEVFPAVLVNGTNGGNVGNKTGGNKTNSVATDTYSADESLHWNMNAGGGGGGGASGNNNGGNATQPSNVISMPVFYPSGFVLNVKCRVGGYGGAGANAVQPAQVTQYGKGGTGANGGGGGGGGGASATKINFWKSHDETARGGAGGSGAKGGQGSNGFIIVYYNSEE